ncbi:MAG: 2-hydroxychromene-2-carboxylate isomerase [Pseudomonadota bacterium]
MSSRAVEFWFDFASTYSYPAAMTLRQAAEARGVEVIWRPFLLGPIFGDLGWTDSPFNLQPAKGRYMWRDLERVCDSAGLPFQRPPGFPQRSVDAAKVALAGLQEDWGEDFIRAVFHVQFADGYDIAHDATLERALYATIGRHPDVMAVRLQEILAGPSDLRAHTEEARDRGIFGAPTYFAGTEMFWGYDRQDAAIDWAATQSNQGDQE